MNRTEYLEKVKTFAAGWFADLKVAPGYHTASAGLGILLYVVVKFFIK